MLDRFDEITEQMVGHHDVENAECLKREVAQSLRAIHAEREEEVEGLKASMQREHQEVHREIQRQIEKRDTLAAENVRMREALKRPCPCWPSGDSNPYYPHKREDCPQKIALESSPSTSSYAEMVAALRKEHTMTGEHLSTSPEASQRAQGISKDLTLKHWRDAEQAIRKAEGR